MAASWMINAKVEPLTSWSHRPEDEGRTAKVKESGSANFITIADFKFSKASDNLLGKGSFGEVWKGWHRNSGQPVAVKAVPKTMREAEKEAAILESLYHPNLVCMMAFACDTTHAYFIMELCAFDLQVLLKNITKFDDEAMQQAAQQLASGYKALHDKSIIHRDIKPGNILVSQVAPYEIVLKISDFGGSEIAYGTLDTAAGTFAYMAPELGAVCYMNSKKLTYDYRVDLWSLGLLFKKCCGGGQLEKTTLLKLFQLAAAGGDDLDRITAVASAVPINVAKGLREIIAGLTKPRASDRWSADTFFKHTYIRERKPKASITLSINIHSIVPSIEASYSTLTPTSTVVPADSSILTPFDHGLLTTVRTAPRPVDNLKFLQMLERKRVRDLLMNEFRSRMALTAGDNRLLFLDKDLTRFEEA